MAGAGPAKPVVLAAYDPAWPETFAALREVYARALGSLAQAIEHVGSTSVPGLLAKPIIDIDIVIPTGADLPRTVEALSRLGYAHNGDQGVPGREAFARSGQRDVPRDGSSRLWPAHHLYVCAAGATELRRHLTFRDWLRAHPGTAAAYGALKERLASLYPDDRDRYCDEKTAFVEATLREVAAWPLAPT